MATEKDKVIEYTANYRDNERKIIKCRPITNVTSKQVPTKITLKVTNNNTPNEKMKTKIVNISTEENKEYVKKQSPNEQDNLDLGYIEKNTKIKKRIGIYRIFLACITMILSCLGAIILFSALDRTTTVINDSPTFTKYSKYIAPIVMQNPEPFSSPSEANTDMVITSSIWRTIYQNGIESYTQFDDQGQVLIPVQDIQNSCADLFGPELTIKTDKDIFGAFYSHTVGDANFHISAISNLGTYVPLVEKITEEGNDLSLTVAYLSREDKYLSNEEDKPDQPTPVKRMEYKLKINETTNKYYIYAIENI